MDFNDQKDINHIQFSGRRNTLFRKSFELNDLCGVDVLVLIKTGSKFHLFLTDEEMAEFINMDPVSATISVHITH